MSGLPRCPSCGAPISTGVTRCGYCGIDLVAALREAPDPLRGSAPPPANAAPVVMTMLAALALSMAGGVAFFITRRAQVLPSVAPTTTRTTTPEPPSPTAAPSAAPPPNRVLDTSTLEPALREASPAINRCFSALRSAHPGATVLTASIPLSFSRRGPRVPPGGKAHIGGLKLATFDAIAVNDNLEKCLARALLAAAVPVSTDRISVRVSLTSTAPGQLKLSLERRGTASSF